MTDEALQMLTRLENRGDSDATVNVTDEMGQLALRIVIRSLFSADVRKTAHTWLAPEIAIGATAAPAGATAP